MRKILVIAAALCLFSCKKKENCVVCNGEKIGCKGTYNPAEWEFVTWEAWKAAQLINPDCQEIDD